MLEDARQEAKRNATQETGSKMQTKTTTKTTKTTKTTAKAATAPKVEAKKAATAPKVEAKTETPEEKEIRIRGAYAGHGAAIPTGEKIVDTNKPDASRPGTFRAELVTAIRTAGTVEAALRKVLSNGKRPSARDVAFCAGMGYIRVQGVELSRADVVPAAVKVAK